MIKRIFDFTLSLVLIVIFSPILLFVSFMIYVFMGSPIFFIQKRPGYNEKIFSIIKFRTMLNTRDINGQFLPDSERLVGFGKIVRSFSLDELPQLLNVLKGDMSFVGPRPLLIEYLDRYTSEQKRRHDVKPGITGWAQVNGRNAISWEEKFKLDIWYVNHYTFILDLKILWLTFLNVIKRVGISSENNVTMEKFNPKL
jgi:undecaprenyl phosphate N,N'-diacetylbacillosamine 1-phosphate transferase